ncbi:MAG: GHMP family kinase ATP-binding protein [Thermoplasmatota archaeon]
MLIRSRAPLRISFCGGGTDVPPYPQERGGLVLSATINKYAYATLIPCAGRGVEVRSLDYNVVASYDTPSDLIYNGELDLVKASLKRMHARGGMRLFLHSDAPPGSGLGSSSTMAVALVGLLRHYLKRPMTDYEIAEMAYEIERRELGVSGGMQDQYAAAFGGFNLIEFNPTNVVVNPLRVPEDCLNELEYHLVLCYTGRTRLSANILRDQVRSYMERKRTVMDALDRMKALTIEMKNALLTGKLEEFGALMHEAWLEKKKLARRISSVEIDRMYELARRKGALGGKILGAGGGGYLVLYCDFERKHIVTEALERAGGEVVEFGFEPQGLRTWEVNEAEGERRASPRGAPVSRSRTRRGPG